MSSEAEEDLRWWVNNLSHWNGRKVSQPFPYCVIEKNTSNIGWGAFLKGEAMGGCWGPEEQRLHINKLELLAVSYAVKSFLKREENIEVLIKSVNIAVVSYISKLGVTKSPRLIALTKQIFAWCLHRQIRVSAQQLPVKENLTADFLSRHLRDRTDWMLMQWQDFQSYQPVLGPLGGRPLRNKIFSPAEPIL